MSGYATYRDLVDRSSAILVSTATEEPRGICAKAFRAASLDARGCYDCPLLPGFPTHLFDRADHINPREAASQ